MKSSLNAEARAALLSSLPQASDESVADFNSSLSSAAEACDMRDYQNLPGPELQARPVSGRMITYASPDSAYSVTRRLIEGAQSSIVIGIYDFTAGYVKEMLLRAMQRGVTVSLMLDLNSRQGEEAVYNQLRNRGATTSPAPSCSGGGQNPYFNNAHEKLIVVDGEWTMVQSGNWSENSIPFNEGDGVVVGEWAPGNRDTGVAVQSPELAAFFTRLIQSDMALELGEAEAETFLRASRLNTTFLEDEVFAEAPPRVPEELFPSRTFPVEAPVSIRPVLSPDNYMEVVPDLLRSARRSVWIEQQYIRAHQPTIKVLLDAIRAARAANPGLDVRIIAAPRDKGVPSMKAVLAQEYDLRAPDNVRLLNGAFFESCHNKLIVVDGERVLVGSQNWSTTAVTINREASLLIEHEGVASYFADIFDADWRMSGSHSEGEGEGPTGRRLFASPAFASGLVIPLSPGDYTDV